ncbi:MAG: dihydrodipicolinate synthase family protein [Bacteroidales bacterium]
MDNFHIAVPTAFHSDESLDTALMIDYIESLRNKGVKSVLVCGSTGEQHSLSLEEKLQIAEALSQSGLTSSMEVIFGVSAVRQKQAVELARELAAMPVSGILLGFPPYILPDQLQAVRYANAIIDSFGRDVILYNNPIRTGFDLSLDAIRQLSAISGVVGLKEAGDPEKVRLLKSHIMKSGFLYFAGGDIALSEKVAIGFNALSSVAANLNYSLVYAYFKTLLSQTAGNKQLQEEFTALLSTLYEGNVIVRLKKLLNASGNRIGICRTPLGE